MAVLIEPTEADQRASAPQATVLGFWVWLRAWIPHHRAAAGAAACVAVGVVALVLSAVGFSATPNVPPAQPVSRAVSVVTQNAAQVTSAFVQRDQWDDVVSRGQVLGSEPFTVDQLVGISVTVEGPGATCRILIDDRLVDEASVPLEGGQATCMWVAPSR